MSSILIRFVGLSGMKLITFVSFSPSGIWQPGTAWLVQRGAGLVGVGGASVEEVGETS